MTDEEIRQAETAWFSDPRTKDKKNVSGRAYRRMRSRPLLLIYAIRPELKDGVFDTGGATLVSVGLCFPLFDDSQAQHRVAYRVNQVWWRDNVGAETGDDEETDEN